VTVRTCEACGEPHDDVTLTDDELGAWLHALVDAGDLADADDELTAGEIVGMLVANTGDAASGLLWLARCCRAQAKALAAAGVDLPPAGPMIRMSRRRLH
jgi:hypothetical protein